MEDAVPGILKAGLWKRSQFLLYKLLGSFRAIAFETPIFSDR